MKHTRTTRSGRVEVEVTCCILFVRISARVCSGRMADSPPRGPEAVGEGLLLGRGGGSSDRAAESWCGGGRAVNNACTVAAVTNAT